MSATTKRNARKNRVIEPSHREPAHAEIAVCARAIWQAEAQLRQDCKAAATAATSGQ